MKRIFILLLMQIACVAFISAQTAVFKPISATIKDSQGSYTSQNFNCSNMVVGDKTTSVSVSFGGNKATLYPNQYNNDTYEATLSQGTTQVKIMAYRSSSTNKIYLIVMTTRKGNESLTIKFKP